MGVIQWGNKGDNQEIIHVYPFTFENVAFKNDNTFEA